MYKNILCPSLIGSVFFFPFLSLFIRDDVFKYYTTDSVLSGEMP